MQERESLLSIVDVHSNTVISLNAKLLEEPLWVICSPGEILPVFRGNDIEHKHGLMVRKSRTGQTAECLIYEFYCLQNMNYRWAQSDRSCYLHSIETAHVLIKPTRPQ